MGSLGSIVVADGFTGMVCVWFCKQSKIILLRMLALALVLGMTQSACEIVTLVNVKVVVKAPV